MTVFWIQCKFFIVLPNRLRTCRLMDFFLEGKICAPEKLGASQRFCAPERAWSALGAQFFQTWDCALCLPDVKSYRRSQQEVFFAEDIVRIVTTEAATRGVLQRKVFLRLQLRCFPVKLAKIFKNTFFEEHLWTTDSITKYLKNTSYGVQFLGKLRV